MRRKIVRAFCALLAAILVPGGADSAGTHEDYERANGIGERLKDKVFRDRVHPIWAPDGSFFWYRIKTGPEAHEFILVDIRSGARREAFDHARLARAMRKAGLGKVKADRLPLDFLEPDPAGGVFGFSSNGQGWRCDPSVWKLTKDPDAAKPPTLPPADEGTDRTFRNGPETSITVVNRTSGEIELVWLDWGGERKSYARIAAGGRCNQHTFAGHVWLILDAKGKPLGTYAAREEPSTIEVTGPVAPAPKDRKTREERRGESPDGKLRALIKSHNVFLKDIKSGHEWALTKDGTEEDGYRGELHWAPDSRRLVAIRTRKGGDRKVTVVESSPVEGLQPVVHSWDYLKPGDPIPRELPVLFDVERRRKIPMSMAMCPTPWSNSDIMWAQDSSRFTFLYNQRGHQVIRLISVDALTGRTKVIVDERSKTFIDYAGKLYMHFIEKTGELIWRSERDGWDHLYLIDSKSGKVKNQITKGKWVVRRVLRVDEERRQVWFLAGGIRPERDPYYLDLARVNLDGSGLMVLAEGDGTHEIKFSPNEETFIDRWSRVDKAPVTELRRSADGSLICVLETADARALIKEGWRAPERFSAPGRDGVTPIYGIIITPTNFNPRRRYPVIERIYAGPQGSFVPKDFGVLTRDLELAELGFVMVRIDGMGTSHRSKKFHDVCWKNLGDAGFPDRIAWMKAAGRTRPWMDLSRVGIFGGSAGGQNAMRALIAHNDFYKVAIADCGCHDNRMDKIWWNELYMGWPVGPHYAEQSNVTQAHFLKGKLMLIVGELDRNVDPASTMQVANALVKAGKDFDLLVMPDTGHGAGDTPYAWRRTRDFFVRHLLGVEPRAGRRKGE